MSDLRRGLNAVFANEWPRNAFAEFVKQRDNSAHCDFLVAVANSE